MNRFKLKLATAIAAGALAATGAIASPLGAQAASGNNWIQIEKGNTCGVNISPNYPKPNWYYNFLPSGYSGNYMANVRAFWVSSNCTVFDIGRSRSYKTNYWHQLPDGAGLGYYLRVKSKG